VSYDILSGGKPPEPPSSSFILHQAEIQDLEFFPVNFIISVIKKKRLEIELNYALVLTQLEACYIYTCFGDKSLVFEI
jgi:transcriptional regulatory protein LevR